jgi:hypothetical protein
LWPIRQDGNEREERTMAQLVDRRSGATPSGQATEAGDGSEAGEILGLSPEQLTTQSWRLIQNLADALPDDVVRFARQALAEDHPEQALSAIVFGCLRHGTSITTVEYAVLAECLLAVGDDISVLDHVTVGDVERQVLFDFVAVPESLADLLGAGGPDSGSPDPDSDDEEGTDAAARAIDRAVAARFGTSSAALGVWRAWRYPVTGAAWPPPTPVYLVEARDEVAAQELAMAYYSVQDRNPPLGEPVVEVYPSGTELPALHRAVQFAGDLVFEASAPPFFTFADVFDGEPDVDGLPQNLTRVSQDEADRLITYLLSGTPMLVADAQGEDVLDPGRGQSVPLHLRTDGVWIWSDASAYYLREHLIGPPTAFHAYLQTVDGVTERVSDVTLHQAVTWLQSS